MMIAVFLSLFRISSALVPPALLREPSHRWALRSSSEGVEVASKEVGVDMWGNPVTEDEMTAVAPIEEDEPPPEKKYKRSDFAGSEWKIGVNWRDSEKVEVSWFRIKEDGTSQWGFNIGSQGQWKMDEGMYLTVSQDYLLGWNGKKLYTAKIDPDTNYLEGIVRGWKPWEPASVMGRWQAVRLGVDRPKSPPWADLEERILQEEEEKILEAEAQAQEKKEEAERDLATSQEEEIEIDQNGNNTVVAKE